MLDLPPSRDSVSTLTPLQATLDRVVSTYSSVNVRYDPELAGLRPAAEVLSDAAAVDALLEEVFDIYAMRDRQVAASFLVLGYIWYLGVGAIASYLLDRRVPDLRSSAVAVDMRQGAVFGSLRCWVLPDDPAAGHPTVSVVPDLASLRARLVEQLRDEHAEPLFATLRGIAPYGIPAMRANAADRLASIVLWLTEQTGDDDLARREVPALVALLYPKARAGCITIEHAGRSGLFLQRGGCCLNYRLPGKPKCDTCSLHPEAERLQLLRQYLGT
jgi:hypothetical protein